MEGVSALVHQVVNVFHLVLVLASVKQLRKCASDTIICVLREELKQRIWERGLSWEGPDQVLLSYNPLSPILIQERADQPC